MERKLFHYCDCPTTKRQLERKNSSRTPMHSTKVDGEGICLNCGHYAVATREQKNPVSLYKFLTERGQKWTDQKVREGKAGRWQDYYTEYGVGN